MKIAIDISQSLYGTGVSVYTRQLISHLVKLPQKPSLVLFGGSLRRKSELDHFAARLPKTKNKTNHLPPSLYSLLWNNLHLYKAENFTGPVDLIHSSDWAEPPTRLPKVTTVHDLSFMIDPNYTHPKVRQVHKKRLYWVKHDATAIIAVSQATKDDLVKFFDIDPQLIHVIYEGSSILPPAPTSPIVVDRLLNALGVKKPFLLVPGSGHPRKNIARIIKAHQKLSQDFQLVIIGRPSEQETNLKGNNVLFTGFVSDSDYSLLLSQAVCLVYHSLYEGFGLPVLDAFKFGTPVVTSNSSCLPEVAGSAAILVDPQDVDHIHSGIIKAIKNAEIYIKLGRLQSKKFSWQKTAHQTYRYYQQILKS